MKVLAITAAALLFTLSVNAQQPKAGQQKPGVSKGKNTKAKDQPGSNKYPAKFDTINKPWDSLNVYPSQPDTVLKKAVPPRQSTQTKGSKNNQGAMPNNNATTPHKQE